MTGRLVESKGSLARAVLPFVFHLKWGWHRVERAMERGKVPLDELFDRALEWCLANLPVETVYIGEKPREVNAIDSSTIARWRAKAGMDLLGKGYYHRAGFRSEVKHCRRGDYYRDHCGSKGRISS